MHLYLLSNTNYPALQLANISLQADITVDVNELLP